MHAPFQAQHFSAEFSSKAFGFFIAENGGVETVQLLLHPGEALEK